jgi:hypothetical protein
MKGHTIIWNVAQCGRHTEALEGGPSLASLLCGAAARGPLIGSPSVRVADLLRLGEALSDEAPGRDLCRTGAKPA